MSTSGSNEFNAIITRINDNRQAYDKLSNAIFGGNTRDVINVINTGIDVSGPIDENGQNILHLASYAGLLDLIVYFMNELSPEKRPHVNTKDFHGWTPLLAAASNGHIPVCHFLLTNGADPKITNDQKTTPLHYLCRKKEAASFVKTGRDTTKQRQQQNKKDSESYFGVLENLINAGISVDSRNYMGETPLMQAAAKGNEEAVRFLLEHKADIKVTNNKGDTALFYATNAGHEPIVKLIAKKKGDTKEKLITHEVKLDHLSEVFGLMRNVDSGVNLSDRRGFFITHRNCFSGSAIFRFRAPSANLFQKKKPLLSISKGIGHFCEQP